jgi:hypothetical protein
MSHNSVVKTWQYNYHDEPIIFRKWNFFDVIDQMKIEELFLQEDEKKSFELDVFTINFDEMMVSFKKEENTKRQIKRKNKKLETNLKEKLRKDKQIVK